MPRVCEWRTGVQVKDRGNQGVPGLDFCATGPVTLAEMAQLGAKFEGAALGSRSGTFCPFRHGRWVYVPVREHIVDFHSQEAKIFPYGNVFGWDKRL